MLHHWPEIDQTIDLKQWALALGLRQAFLDSLPNYAWAIHLVLLAIKADESVLADRERP